MKDRVDVFEGKTLSTWNRGGRRLGGPWPIERVTACVNACAGIENPEAIGEIVEALKAWDSDPGRTRPHSILDLKLSAALRKLEESQ